VLPEGAHRQDLLKEQLFLRAALENAQKWYDYARGQGRRLSNGSIYLITGCDKAKSWGLAAYADLCGQTDVSIKLMAMQISGLRTMYRYQWEKQGSIEGRVVRNEPPRLRNQCVFARGYRISLRESLFARWPKEIRVSAIGDTTSKPIAKGSSSASSNNTKRSRFLDLLSSPTRQQGPTNPGSSTQLVSAQAEEVDVIVNQLESDVPLVNLYRLTRNQPLNAFDRVPTPTPSSSFTTTFLKTCATLDRNYNSALKKNVASGGSRGDHTRHMLISTLR
jgi:hypothetical protein